MRRPLAAALAVTIACSVAVVVWPALSSAGTRAPAAVRPRTAPVITPAKGIAITMGFANKLTDAKAALIADQLFSFVSRKLHANAVSLNFPFWESGSLSNDPMRAPMTPSPQRMMAITAIAHHYHLSVQWRPFLFESDLLYQTHDSIKPTNAAMWMKNYWAFLQPYLQAANLAGAASFSIALELRTMLPFLSQWTTVVRRAKSMFSGTIVYSQQHLPQVSLPLTARGYDAYQPIKLKTAKDLSVAALTRGFVFNLHASEMQQTPADLTLEEISIPGIPYAYLRPSHFHYAPNVKIDRPVQTEWFEAACNAFYQLHLQGIYFYGIAFDRYTPNEDQTTNPYGWLGTPSAAAIARCFERHTTLAAPSVATGVATSLGARATAHATAVAWGASRPIEPTGGHPSSVSCPTPIRCVEVDLGGDVVTELSGKWSVPEHIDDTPLVSVSCAAASMCVAVDGQGNAFSYDGVSWTKEAAVDSVAFSSVSCVLGTTTCVAVDEAGYAFTYSAGTWSGPVWTRGFPLNGISCAATNFCVAVDVAGFVHVYDGQWEPEKSLGISILTSVACPTTTYCVVGNDEGRLYQYVSGQWHSQAGVIAGGVASVACASPSRCMAVGATATAGAAMGTKWTGGGHVFTGDGAVSVSCAPLGTCTAVSYAGDATVRTTTWGAPFPVDTRPGNITSVGCSSETFCMAVDDAGTAMAWQGSSWTAPLATGVASLSGVSCVVKPSSTESLCVAVSNGGSAVTFNGTTWGKPATIDASALTAVSCATSTYCAATDASNHVLIFNGATWSAPTTEGVPQRYVRGYTAVSCVAPASCVAVDTDGGELFFSPGTSFLYQADTRFVPLTAVACATPSLCVAVDEQGKAVTYTAVGTASTWSPPLSIDPYRLTAVSCTHGGYCLAADDHGGTVAFDNGTWSQPTRTVPLDSTSAISCTGAATCVATNRTDGAVGTATP